MELTEIRKKVKKQLEKERYEHTKGVMYTAGCLAMANGFEVERAMLAGLLHDCAKCIPNEEKLSLCEKNHIPVSKVEKENPVLLHAKLGAFLARKDYGVTDKEILHAIEVHTTGVPDMSMLDKIIYVADYIEPNRDKAPNLSYVRQLAFADLDACVAEILYDTLHYLKKKGGAVDELTETTYEFYEKYRK
jgi:predicted HD superfamily hydrolase involved in NAD metabolism